jgi:dienelactone hydrolase
VSHPELQFRSTLGLIDRLNRDMPRLLGYDERGAKEGFAAWQAEARGKLIELLGFLPATAGPQGWLLESEKVEGFTREQWAITSPFGDHIFTYRLVPDAPASSQPVLLAFHGHGYWGADAVVGVSKGRFQEDEMITACNYDYAAQFARRGYLVYAPCQRGFNQRNDKGEPSETNPGTCLDINQRGILLGVTDIGLRIQDAMRLVDWIKAQPAEADKPLGCVGLSGGGHTTEFLAALDVRIEAASIQGYFCYWTDQILDVTHCACNYVPGLLRYFEQDDVCGMICPRPLLVTTADNDGVAPLGSFNRAFAELGRTYADQGCPADLEEDVFEGGHEFSGRKAFGFFDRHLGVYRC